MADSATETMNNARDQMALELAKIAATLPPEARRTFYTATRDAAAAWLYRQDERRRG